MMERDKVVVVGMGQLYVARNEDHVLAAYGLGSCIGMAAWDPIARVGGMIHIMLPDSELGHQSEQLPARYADTGVPALVQMALKWGADKTRLVVKMSGGAQVLALEGERNWFAIGERNAAAARQALQRLGLTLAAEDVGGNRGRTMQLNLATGRVTVQVVGQAARAL